MSNKNNINTENELGKFLIDSGYVELKDKSIFVNKEGKMYKVCKNGAIKELIPFEKNKGYYSVYVGNKQCLAHNIVAEAFIEGWDADGYSISFKDDDKSNWSLDNLERISSEELAIKRILSKNKAQTKEWLIENGFVNVTDDIFIDSTGDIYRIGTEYQWVYYYQGNYMERPLKRVILHMNGYTTTLTAAYIYAMAFVKNPKNYTNVTFKDRKAERTLKNITWAKAGTNLSQNSFDKRLLNSQIEYKGYENAGLKSNAIAYIERRLEGMTLQEIGDMYGVTKQSISLSLRSSKKKLAKIRGDN